MRVILFLLLVSIPLSWAIIGGKPGSIFRAPFLAYLHGWETEKPKKNEVVHTSGIIVSQWYILASARRLYYMRNVTVSVGSARRPTSPGLPITGVIFHPFFTAKRPSFNASCLIKMSNPLVLGPSVQVAFLPEYIDYNRRMPDNETFYTAGWGITKPEHSEDAYPKQMHMMVTKPWHPKCPHAEGVAVADVICFGYYDKMAKHGKGDEGGPFYVPRTGVVFAMGIRIQDKLSVDKEMKPTFAFVISNHRSWIDEILR